MLNKARRKKICKWSDLRYYDKPKNAYCDWSTSPQWWTCNKWFTAKSEWDLKLDHTSWFCECNSSQVSCLSEITSILIDSMSDEIDKQEEYLNTMNVNQYSQTSVNNYNNQVQNLNNLIWKETDTWVKIVIVQNHRFILYLFSKMQKPLLPIGFEIDGKKIKQRNSRILNCEIYETTTWEYLYIFTDSRYWKHYLSKNEKVQYKNN